MVTIVAIEKESTIDLMICGSSNVNFHHSSDQLFGSLSGYCHSPENARRIKLSNGPKKKRIKTDKQINSTIFRGLTVLKYHNFSHLFICGNVPTLSFFLPLSLENIHYYLQYLKKLYLLTI